MPAAVYHANFRASNSRTSGFQQIFTFGAPDDATATTIAGHVQAATISQLVSLTKQRSPNAHGLPYPTGTRKTVKWYALDADGTVVRYRLRNLKTDSNADDVQALTLGQANVGRPNLIAPLSAPLSVPFAPNDPFTVVIATVNTLT